MVTQAKRKSKGEGMFVTTYLEVVNTYGVQVSWLMNYLDHKFMITDQVEDVNIYPSRNEYGASLTEILGLGVKQGKTGLWQKLFSQIGVAYNSKAAYEDSIDKFQGKLYLSYIDKFNCNKVVFLRNENFKNPFCASSNEDKIHTQLTNCQFMNLPMVSSELTKSQFMNLPKVSSTYIDKEVKEKKEVKEVFENPKSTQKSNKEIQKHTSEYPYEDTEKIENSKNIKEISTLSYGLCEPISAKIEKEEKLENHIELPYETTEKHVTSVTTTTVTETVETIKIASNCNTLKTPLEDTMSKSNTVRAGTTSAQVAAKFNVQSTGQIASVSEFDISEYSTKGIYGKPDILTAQNFFKLIRDLAIAKCPTVDATTKFGTFRDVKANTSKLTIFLDDWKDYGYSLEDIPRIFEVIFAYWNEAYTDCKKNRGVYGGDAKVPTVEHLLVWYPKYLNWYDDFVKAGGLLKAKSLTKPSQSTPVPFSGSTTPQSINGSLEGLKTASSNTSAPNKTLQTKLNDIKPVSGILVEGNSVGCTYPFGYRFDSDGGECVTLEAEIARLRKLSPGSKMESMAMVKLRNTAVDHAASLARIEELVSK